MCVSTCQTVTVSLPVAAELRARPTDRVVQVQPSLVHELHDRGRHDRLGDRREEVEAVRGDSGRSLGPGTAAIRRARRTRPRRPSRPSEPGRRRTIAGLLERGREVDGVPPRSRPTSRAAVALGARVAPGGRRNHPAAIIEAHDPRPADPRNRAPDRRGRATPAQSVARRDADLARAVRPAAAAAPGDRWIATTSPG